MSAGLHAPHERASRWSTATTARCSTSTASSTSGRDAVDGVPDAAGAGAATAGMTLAFVTNNAARTPAAVAAPPARARRRGRTSRRRDVGPGGGARWSPTECRRARAVLVVGGEGLIVALRGARPGAGDARATTTRPRSSRASTRSVGWELLAEAAYAVRAGVPWIASNLDLTVPTARGHRAGQRRPGQRGRRRRSGASRTSSPASRSGRCSTRRSAGSRRERPLVVGDRLDTDIEGAVNGAAPTRCW